MLSLVWILGIARCFIPGNAFTFFSVDTRNRRFREADVTALYAAAAENIQADHHHDSRKKKCKRALLISSFSEGVEQSPDASEFLRDGLLESIQRQRVRDAEEAVKESVMFSPCNGPDLQALENLERVDNYNDNLLFLEDEPSSSSPQQQPQPPTFLRLVYIPTAMYAIRADSSNTPGKQRQRARADGKKRRTAIIRHIQNVLKGVQVLAITLDLDDGSLKQPDGSDDSSLFPKDGKDALSASGWAPHMVYVEGGNTFWLAHCIEKGTWGPHLVDACTNKDAAILYCGNSAGAILAGKTIETALWKGWDDPSIVPGRGESGDWIGSPGLSLAGDASFFPHMSDEWAQLVDEKATNLPGPVYSIRDQDVVGIIDGEVVPCTSSISS